jgi:hypothetical protein
MPGSGPSLRLGLVIVVAAVLVAALFYLSAPRQRSATRPEPPDVTRTLPTPFLMFRTLASADRYGLIAMIPLELPDAGRRFGPLQCARVHFAGGAGVCLVEEPQGTQVNHAAYLFDDKFNRGTRLELSGVPTRVRVAPNGRRAAITVYGEEHLPDGQERLATDSILLDVPSGRVLAKLHEFSLDRPYELAPEAPLDYSSVAFEPDGDRFYATLNSSNRWFIVAGSISSRRLAVIVDGFANEALSPDGLKLAVKQRTGERGFWHAMVLDLKTKASTALDHTRSIDDQIEWLDRDRIAYHDATDQGTGIWVLAIDGQSGPRLLIPDAYSPSVVRK